MQEIKDILINLGYTLTDDKDGWRTNAMFRGGNNQTALKIYNKPLENGIIWFDFVEGHKGTLEDLVKLTLGEKIDPKEWLMGKIDLNDIQTKKTSIILPQVFNEDILKDLIQDYTYITKRGISLDTAKIFSCGICLDSQTLLQKLKNRQVFCIYNSKKQLVGFSGRSLDEKNKLKYKHLGGRNGWVYPVFINHSIIKEQKEVILIEGVFDAMRLWDLGIKNSMVLFGTELSHAVLNYLLKVNPKKIIIATNNELDSDNGGVGNDAAVKIYNRLKRYFNLNQIKIHLPPAKDFAEIKDDKTIVNWYNNR